MRRSSRWPGLVLVGLLGLSDTGTALGEDREPPPTRGRAATPVWTGIVDVDRAAEWDRILGPPFRDEITRRVRPVFDPRVHFDPEPTYGGRWLWVAEPVLGNGALSDADNCPSGGPWPTPSWKPANLGSPAQLRSPIVPLAGGSRAFYTTQDGWVHAVDAKTGAVLWETQIATAARAAPAGIFTAFAGAWDSVVGAPSLDVGFSPNLLQVGSEGGVVYAVEVPL